MNRFSCSVDRDSCNKRFVNDVKRWRLLDKTIIICNSCYKFVCIISLNVNFFCRFSPILFVYYTPIISKSMNLFIHFIVFERWWFHWNKKKICKFNSFHEIEFRLFALSLLYRIISVNWSVWVCRTCFRFDFVFFFCKSAKWIILIAKRVANREKENKSRWLSAVSYCIKSVYFYYIKKIFTEKKRENDKRIK